MKSDKKQKPEPIADKKEKSINLRLPCTPENDVYSMIDTLAKSETRSINSMIIELIKRASKK